MSTPKRPCEAMNKDRSLGTFNDKYPLTIYLLTDLRVVYIITFAFITTVSLISSTASIHASFDKSKMTPFDVSSEYMNVNVTSINDAVLWNCRKLSPTSNYYKSLYSIVIITVVVLLAGYFLIKLSALFVIKENALTKLWHMAILIYLLSKRKLEVDVDLFDFDKLLASEIPKDVMTKISSNWNNRCRLIIPYILLLLLVAMLCMAYFSYDLHPLACILEPEEELITYKENSVELKFSFSLLIYQKVVACIVLLLAIVFVICLRFFFYFTKKTIDNLQQEVKHKIQRPREQDQNVESKQHQSVESKQHQSVESEQDVV